MGNQMPFIPAYEAMLNKADRLENLPETKEHQNRNITSIFFSYFSNTTVEKMQAVLQNERYVPQEILNRADF